jgi:F-type H+-transporting ATPase subunit delta
MKSNDVVKKYSKALFDVTYSNGKSGEVAQQLNELSKCFTKQELQFFSNPFNAQADKQSVIKNSLEGKASVEVINFICLLSEKNRMSFLNEISTAYTSLVHEAAGITKGKIFSAVLLEESFISQVEHAVSQTLNKKITLTFEKDEKLLAGYKVQVGSWTLDDSAQIHLKIIKDELMKRGL